ncbi:protein ADM2a [Nerophis lumbriciformis]|uniref:protein ADM2a n=1 Tax=Nerophis lumbriciformis TaxID=546530 RepID=UPI002ADFBE12|nr:protein ADM2-like [Nerophis lumbriciformis]XP_061816699.1 protein ADM2-like [Nerophis lumbriciformis]
MRSLLPLTVYCISLVCFQQLLAEDSWDHLNKLTDLKENPSLPSEGQTNTPALSSEPTPTPKWNHLPASSLKRTNPSLAWARPDERLEVRWRKGSRARRHTHLGFRAAHHYPHHAQLMRVGCVLGTCQVQNLSHRLYQLIGQSGREDSSPINPRSPHSYG